MSVFDERPSKRHAAVLEVLGEGATVTSVAFGAGGPAADAICGDRRQRARIAASARLPLHMDRLQHASGIDGPARTAIDIDRIPPSMLPVVFHSAAVTYLPEPARHRPYARFAQAGSQRPLVWLSYEGTRIEPLAHLESDRARPTGSFTVAAATWTEGHRADHLLGFADPHGEWVQWHASGMPSAE